MLCSPLPIVQPTGHVRSSVPLYKCRLVPPDRTGFPEAVERALPLAVIFGLAGVDVARGVGCVQTTMDEDPRTW